MILSVENAAFHYPNRRPLFENLSFELATPSVMSVLGANGAGKTTLLKCILGFEKWSPAVFLWTEPTPLTCHLPASGNALPMCRKRRVPLFLHRGRNGVARQKLPRSSCSENLRHTILKSRIGQSNSSVLQH